MKKRRKNQMRILKQVLLEEDLKEKEIKEIQAKVKDDEKIVMELYKTKPISKVAEKNTYRR